MKSYLKSLTKSLYEKVQRVVQDEYIQPINELEVYRIINRKRKFSNSNKNDKESTFGECSQQSFQIMQNIQRLGLITPERQFLLIGDSYSIEVVNYRLKQLKTKIQSVKQFMLNNYETNLQCIEKSLNYLQDVKVLTKTKQKAQSLRQRLAKLQQLVSRTKRITQLNIKIKNIKQTLKILQKVPNLKKMTLFQLKNIDINKLSSFKHSIKTYYHKKNTSYSIHNTLHCIENVQHFIDNKVSQHLRTVIQQITNVLIEKFYTEKYQIILKDFLIAKSTIDYQKLIIRLVESEIRDKNAQIESSSRSINNSSSERIDLDYYANVVFNVCKKYITILINLSKLLRFHRNNCCALDNTQLESFRSRTISNNSESQHPYLNLQSQSSIHIHTQQVKSLTCTLMDQCIKQLIQQILLNSNILNEQIFQVLALINNFYQIAFAFTSYLFPESKLTIYEFLLRKNYKLHEEGINEFNQTLNQQDDYQWNRLPVSDNYKCKAIERTIQKINRLFLIQKLPHLYCQNFKSLNQSSPQSFQLQIAQNRQQTFQMMEVEFPYDKLEKTMINIESNQSKLTEHQDPVVVICKSSLVVLKYFEQFMQMYCYFPIEEIRNDILYKMGFYIDYYIYFLFETFLSQMYKKFFTNQHQTLQDRYHHFRVKYLYKEVYQFINDFKQNQTINNIDTINGINNQETSTRINSIEISKYKTRGFSFVRNEIIQSKVSNENSVKARAIATDSIKYILAYFTRILNHLKKYTQPQEQQNKGIQKKNHLFKYIQKIPQYHRIQDQLSDLLLNDSVPVSTKIDFVVPIMKKIKWNQLQSTKQIGEYGGMIMKNVREIYEKMKSMSKGSIPYYIVDRIFSFYWRTQLTFITKTFLQDHINQKQKGGKASKLSFQKLIDILYEEVTQIIDGKIRSKQLISNGKTTADTYSNQRMEMFKSSYLKIKSIFPILLQTDWERCRQMNQALFTKFQFIYKITLNIIRASESCSGLTGNEMEQRIVQMERFLLKQVLK